MCVGCEFLSCDESCQENIAHLDTWTVRTMKGGQIQVKLSGKTVVIGRLLVLG